MTPDDVITYQRADFIQPVVCAYSKCGKEFLPIRKHQAYCCAKHRKHAWLEANPCVDIRKRPPKEVIEWVMRYLAMRGVRKRARAKRERDQPRTSARRK